MWYRCIELHCFFFWVGNQLTINIYYNIIFPPWFTMPHENDQWLAKCVVTYFINLHEAFCTCLKWPSHVVSNSCKAREFQGSCIFAATHARINMADIEVEVLHAENGKVIFLESRQDFVETRMHHARRDAPQCMPQCVCCTLWGHMTRAYSAEHCATIVDLLRMLIFPTYADPRCKHNHLITKLVPESFWQYYIE